MVRLSEFGQSVDSVERAEQEESFTTPIPEPLDTGATRRSGRLSDFGDIEEVETVERASERPKRSGRLSEFGSLDEVELVEPADDFRTQQSLTQPEGFFTPEEEDEINQEVQRRTLEELETQKKQIDDKIEGVKDPENLFSKIAENPVVKLSSDFFLNAIQGDFPTAVTNPGAFATRKFSEILSGRPEETPEALRTFEHLPASIVSETFKKSNAVANAVAGLVEDIPTAVTNPLITSARKTIERLTGKPEEIPQSLRTLEELPKALAVETTRLVADPINAVLLATSGGLVGPNTLKTIKSVMNTPAGRGFFKEVLRRIPGAKSKQLSVQTPEDIMNALKNKDFLAVARNQADDLNAAIAKQARNDPKLKELLIQQRGGQVTPPITPTKVKTAIPVAEAVKTVKPPSQPIKPPSGLKERQSLKTIIESPKTEPKIADILKQQPERFVKVKTLKESQARAQQIIDDDLERSIIMAKEGSKLITGDERVALAEKTVSKLLKEQPNRVDDVIDVIRNTALAETEAGRLANAAKLWKRVSPAGMLRSAERELTKAADLTGKDPGKVIGEITRDAGKAVDDAVNEVVNDVIKPPPPKKPGLFGRKKTPKPKKPEQMLAERIQATQRKGKKNPIQDMVATLFKVAKESPIKEIKPTQRSPLQFVAQAIKQRAKFKDVFEKSKTIVAKKFAGDKEALAALDKFLKNPLEQPFAKRQISEVAREQLKRSGVNLKELAKSHFKKKDATVDELKKTIIKRAKLSEEDASGLAKLLDSEFKTLIKTKQDQLLKSKFGRRFSPARIPLDKQIAELVNLGALNNSRLKEAVAKKLKVPILTKDLASEIVRISNKLQTLNPRSKEFTKELAILRAKIGEQIPSGTLVKFKTGDIAQLLINFTTPMRNLIGMTLFGAPEYAANQLVAPVIDSAINQIRKVLGKPQVRTKLFTPIKTAKESLKGFKQGYKDAYEDLVLGIDRAPNVNQFDIAVKGPVFKSKVGQWAEKALNLTLRVPDRAFFSATFRASLNNQIRAMKASGAKLKDIKERFDEMVEIATYDGLIKTFQDPNIVSHLTRGIQKLLNDPKNRKLEFGAGSIVMPFPKTPGALVKRGAEYSPLGLGEAAVQLARAGAKREFGFKEQKKFVESLSRAATGRGMVAVGGTLFALGLIVPKRENKGETNRELDRSAGLMDYQGNLSASRRWILSRFSTDPEVLKWRPGDQLIGLDFLQPVAMPIFIGANIEQNKNENRGAVAEIWSAMKIAFESAARQPVFTGFRRLMRGTEDEPLQGLENTLLSIPPRLVNTMFRKVALAVDPERKVVKDDDKMKEALNRLKAAIPGLRGTLPTQLGLFGEEELILREKELSKRIIQAVFNPAIINRFSSKDPAKQEIIRLREATGLTPRTKSGLEKITEKKFQLDNLKLGVEQARDFKKKTGQSMKEAVSNLIENPGYQSLSDEHKLVMINKVLGQAKEQQRGLLISDILIERMADELKGA